MASWLVVTVDEVAVVVDGGDWDCSSTRPARRSPGGRRRRLGPALRFSTAGKVRAEFGCSAGAQAEPAVFLPLPDLPPGPGLPFAFDLLQDLGPAAVTIKSAASRTVATSPSGMSGSSSTWGARESRLRSCPSMMSFS